MFHCSTQKMVQAAGVLLRRERPWRMGRLRLLKLLYIADRESLQETGRPILGTRVVAMKHGPLHSEVLDLINGRHIDEPLWSEFIRQDGRHVELAKDPGVSELSRGEIEKLQQISEQLANLDDWSVAELTHRFQEWRDCYRENSSCPIPLEAIIQAAGRSDDMDDILQDAKDDAAFDRFFAGLP